MQSGNSVIVSAFRTSLLHQLLVVFLIATLCAIAFNVIRTIQYRRGHGRGRAFSHADPTMVAAEAPARRIVRIGFGCFWILDGLLQLQSSMPLGLPSNVLQPSASGSPEWVQHLVSIGATAWTDHPIQAAVATVWIQVGIGVWLLVAPRGRWSRLAGVVSLGWGLTVWGFGEAFGGIFAPGLTWLFGAPGAVLFYCIGGALVALPERSFETPRLGRIMLRLGGAFLLGMAVLQAWPGRGYWQGRGGSLSAMVQTMAQTSQPRALAASLRAFAAFDTAHGWAVNLFVVVALAVLGGLFLSGRRRLVLGGLVGLVVLCLADWVLVEDLGVFGGTGTDPNSMLPMLLFFVGGYVAAFRLPARRGNSGIRSAPGGRRGRCPSGQSLVGAELARVPRPLARRAGRHRRRPGGHRANGHGCGEPQRRPDPDRGSRRHPQCARHTGAILQPDRPAWPNGEPGESAGPRPGADLPRPCLHVGLPAHRPGIPPHRRTSRRAEEGVDFVAVVANPIYRSTSFTDQFDDEEGLAGVSNWYYLTGSLHELQHVWNSYGVLVDTVANGAMVAHSDLAFMIDGRGHERDALIDDPGPTQAFGSSFSSLLLSRIQAVLPT